MSPPLPKPSSWGMPPLPKSLRLASAGAPRATRGRSNACSPARKQEIWIRAAGRCQYAGCNRHMVGDLVSGNEDARFGFVAHIVADAPCGPRGDPVRSHLLADDISNLMLLCHAHHKLVDVDEVNAHPEARLLEMKRAHERRIEVLTAMQEDRSSHALCYAAAVGAHEALVTFEMVRDAMLPDRYPAEGRSIRIEMLGSAFQDSDPAYWEIERTNLRRKFDALVRQRIQAREIARLDVFALAPQPLLVELGRLLGDIVAVDVRQLHREPKGWAWAEKDSTVEFRITCPERTAGPPALVLALSADVQEERVEAALGEKPAVWVIAAAAPGNDIMRSKADLAEFGRLVRVMLNRIKAAHGEAAVLSVFPALPVSAAIELGRAWMPKADLPMLVFDQNRLLGGFVPALEVRPDGAAVYP